MGFLSVILQIAAVSFMLDISTLAKEDHAVNSALRFRPRLPLGRGPFGKLGPPDKKPEEENPTAKSLMPRFGTGNRTASEGKTRTRILKESFEADILPNVIKITECGLTYLLKGGQTIMLYSSYDYEAYTCHNTIKTLDEGSKLQMTCPAAQFRFICSIESLTIVKDGEEKKYCKSPTIPDIEAQTLQVTYNRVFKGFHGGYMCLIQATETPPPEPEQWGKPDSELQRNMNCGLPKKRNENHRIVGGEDAKKGEFPWHVHLEITDAVWESTFYCGGTLITPEFIVSAAHCFDFSIKKIMATFASYSKDSIDQGQTTKEVTKKHVHEKYDDEFVLNDIALLKLKDPVTFDDNIQPICLPSQNFNPEGAVTGVGMGSLSYNGKVAEQLQQVSVLIQPLTECQKDWEGFDSYHIVTSQQICAKAPGKDTCSGDSGGSLIKEKEGYMVIVGITSYGYKCADKVLAGVYTSVSKYITWLRNTAAKMAAQDV